MSIIKKSELSQMNREVINTKLKELKKYEKIKTEYIEKRKELDSEKGEQQALEIVLYDIGGLVQLLQELPLLQNALLYQVLHDLYHLLKIYALQCEVD